MSAGLVQQINLIAGYKGECSEAAFLFAETVNHLAGYTENKNNTSPRALASRYATAAMSNAWLSVNALSVEGEVRCTRAAKAMALKAAETWDAY